ncbi:hypothetical protein [Sphingobacterium sp. HMA12]|uniref:hypothetical protein n=1 Tax=Sphingobacterium sp. HMA12 TaxID=2050894 RepID=UPI0013154404|nr:hypothetical protein [Sphingobacterium sp. HMA12]
METLKNGYQSFYFLYSKTLLAKISHCPKENGRILPRRSTRLPAAYLRHPPSKHLWTPTHGGQQLIPTNSFTNSAADHHAPPVKRII